MKNLFIITVVMVITLLLFTAEPALAGPGGKIARAAFETFWGKVILIALIIIFFPLILYTTLREKLAERRARSDLRFMANHSSIFEWLKLQERAKECFYRIHSSWEAEDLSDTASWMTDWYWQNQQLVHLEKWKKEGVVNICQIKKITQIKPILFVHRNHGSEHEDSMLVIAIEAEMNDYLKRRESDKIIEGSKKFREIETIWSFTLENGIWKVSDIEESRMSIAYVKAIKDLPNIETTIVSDLRA